MKNSRRVRDFLTGAVTTALLVGTVGSAFAFSGSKNIDVIYRDIKLVVDGVAVTPKDANGKEVEPFVFEGTTYLPVRAVGEAVGKTVEWDGENNTVYLGTKPGEDANLLQVCPPYEKTDGVILYDGSDATAYFTMSGQRYTDGIVSKYGYSGVSVYFNLNGDYETLEFDLGHVDGSDMWNKNLYIYLDGEVVKEFENLDPEAMVQHVTVPLKGALQLKIEFKNGSDFRSHEAKYGLGNISIK